MRSLTPYQWTGIALVAVALPALTATAWPLLAFLRGLLPDDLPLGRILLGVALVVVLVIAAVLIRAQRRTSFRLWWLILTAWAVAIGAVAGMVVLIWLVLGTPGLDLPSDLSPRALDAIATRAFAVVAGLGGVALLVIHYRRQRTTEADAQRAESAAEREVSKLFTDTFDSASEKLGSEHAAVRLAGVHALARLADEAPRGREDLVQMVIDVLCAYLRMPYNPEPETLSKNASRDRKEKHRERELEFASFREVRHTIIRIIGDRLRKDTRWRGKDYDFTRVVFDGGELTGAHFTGGTVSFQEAEFISGVVNFTLAQFIAGEVNFYGAQFTGGIVPFRAAEFSGAWVNFRGVGLSEEVVDFGGTRFSGGDVSFQWGEFTAGLLGFHEVEFTGGKVSFKEAVFAGATVDFRTTEFTDEVVDFVGAKFAGGRVYFTEASGTCPRALVEAMEHGEPGVVVLPDRWQPTGDRKCEREGLNRSDAAPDC